METKETIPLPVGIGCLKCCSQRCKCAERKDLYTWVPCSCQFCLANPQAHNKNLAKRVPAAYFTNP